MKKITPFRFGIIFAGGFLGAGFLSGREIWQYFVKYGVWGYIGFAVAILFFIFLGSIGVTMSKEQNLQTGEELFLLWDLPVLHYVLTGIQAFTLFAIVAAMVAGIVALFVQMLGVNALISSVLITALLLIVSFAGLNGVASVFSMTVPILVMLTIIFGIGSFFKSGGTNIQATKETTLIIDNWIASAIIFACYNLYGVLVRVFYFGKEMKDKKEIRKGTIFGGCLLLIVALCDMVAIYRFPESSLLDLPMLFVASAFGPGAEYVYAALLFLGMFGTALSSLVGLTQFFSDKSSRVAKHRKMFSAGISILVFVVSLIGFSNIVGMVYPIIGYVTFIFLLFMVVRYLLLRKEQKKRGKVAGSVDRKGIRL